MTGWRSAGRPSRCGRATSCSTRRSPRPRSNGDTFPPCAAVTTTTTTPRRPRRHPARSRVTPSIPIALEPVDEVIDHHAGRQQLRRPDGRHGTGPAGGRWAGCPRSRRRSSSRRHDGARSGGRARLLRAGHRPAGRAHPHACCSTPACRRTGMADNMERLGIDAGDIEAVVLSHGHFDHAGGFAGLARLRRRSGLPITLHPLVWTRRRVAFPGPAPVGAARPARRSSLEAEGFEVIERRQPSLLLDGSVLITGEVDRTTDFEQGMPFHEAERDGRWEPDPLILDDQALVVHVRGQGPRRADRLRPRRGGQHRSLRPAAHRRRPAARRARRLPPDRAGVRAAHRADRRRAGRSWHPDLVVPAHCTGWRAQHRLAAALPDAFVPNAVGTSFVLRGLSPVEGAYARRSWGGAGPSGSRCCAASQSRRARRATTARVRRPIPRWRSRRLRRRPRRRARRRRHRPPRRPRRSRRPPCRHRPRARRPTRPRRRGPSGTGSATGRSRWHRGRTSSASPRDRCRSPPSTAASCGIAPNLLLADGKPPGVDVIHLHHGVWLNLRRPGRHRRRAARAVLRRRRGEDDHELPDRLRLPLQGERPVGHQLHAAQPLAEPTRCGSPTTSTSSRRRAGRRP